jgi:hypothetical protein
LENWFEVEFILLKILRLQPSELDRLDFYRAEILMENLKNWQEKEQDHHKRQEDDQQKSMPSFNQSSLMRDAGNLMKGAGSSMPSLPSSMPSFGNFGNLNF